MTRRIGSLAWLADRPDWQADAACLGQGPDGWFPRRAPGTATADQVDQAKAICHGCPAREECFRYAMRHNIKHGVWGGTSVTERRNIRRRRLARAA
jgi:WhiB family redox-sensing transcriptional regulator